MEIERDNLLGLIIKDENVRYVVKNIIESTDSKGNKHYNLIVDKTK